MSGGINVLALLKGGERYVFLFDDKSHDKLLDALGACAMDPELSFTWYDAAVLSQRLRQIHPGNKTPVNPPYISSSPNAKLPSSGVNRLETPKGGDLA